MHIRWVFCFLIFVSSPVKAQVAIPGDYADPSIIKVNRTYYSVGTSSEWAPHFPIFKSYDLTNWQSAGYVFNEKPSWTLSSFWAPELYYRNGLFYLYYTSRRASDSISCIGVATSKDPEKGFTDHGVVIEYGKEAIDAFVIEADSGLYITWKAYGLDKRPIELLGARLSDDGLKLSGEPFTLMVDTAKIGMEGQCMVKKDGYYYLFYSAGGCCGVDCSYEIRVARSKSIRGPYTNTVNLLKETKEWKCPGHGTVVKDGDDWYYMFHAYNKKENVYTGRQGLLMRLDWKDGSPVLPGSASGIKTQMMIADRFYDSKLADQWQWDFRNSAPQIKVGEGQLCVSSTVSDKNITGTALTVRPLTGNYTMTVTGNSAATSLHGLTVYGDVSSAVGISVKNKVVEVWQVKNNKRTVLATQKVNDPEDEIQLRLIAKKGNRLTFAYKPLKAKVWMTFPKLTAVDGSYLPQWDRSPRPGLHFAGGAKDSACFADFTILFAP